MRKIFLLFLTIVRHNCYQAQSPNGIFTVPDWAYLCKELNIKYSWNVYKKGFIFISHIERTLKKNWKKVYYIYIILIVWMTFIEWIHPVNETGVNYFLPKLFDPAKAAALDPPMPPPKPGKLELLLMADAWELDMPPQKDFQIQIDVYSFEGTYFRHRC